MTTLRRYLKLSIWISLFFSVIYTVYGFWILYHEINKLASGEIMIEGLDYKVVLKLLFLYFCIPTGIVSFLIFYYQGRHSNKHKRISTSIFMSILLSLCAPAFIVCIDFQGLLFFLTLLPSLICTVALKIYISYREDLLEN